MSRWPTLPRMCLTCRTALGDAEGCDAGAGHEAVSPADPLGSERLRQVVWGSPAVRRRAVEHARGDSPSEWLASLMVVAAIVLTAATTTFLYAGPLIAGALGVVLVAAVSAGKARRWLRAGAKQRLLQPRGAVDGQAGNDAGVVRVVGEVELRDTRGRTPPFGGADVVAYGLWVYARDELTLSECATVGFDVRTDNGDLLRVAPGRCRIEPVPPIDPDEVGSRVRRHVAARYDREDDAGEFPLIPVDRHAVAAVRPGQRIEVVAAVESRPDATAAPGDYRSAHPSLQVAIGVPVLRLHHSRA